MEKGLVELARPVIEMPKSVPLVGRLGGEIGKARVEAVRKYAQKFGGENSTLAPFKYQGGEVTNSNLYGLILMHDILSEDGAKIAGLAGLEAAQRAYDADNSIGLNGRGVYRDLGIVLRSGSVGRNSALVPTLIDELKGIDKRMAKLDVPVIIPVSSLVLEPNAKMPDGYALHIKNHVDETLIEAPQLVAKNHGLKFSRTDAKGLPIFSEQGNRTLYTSKDALSRLYLYRSLDLSSNIGILAGSYEYGRVDFELGGANAENFIRLARAKVNANLGELQAQYDAQLKAGNAKLELVRKELRL